MTVHYGERGVGQAQSLDARPPAPNPTPPSAILLSMLRLPNVSYTRPAFLSPLSSINQAVSPNENLTTPHTFTNSDLLSAAKHPPYMSNWPWRTLCVLLNLALLAQDRQVVIKLCHNMTTLQLDELFTELRWRIGLAFASLILLNQAPRALDHNMTTITTFKKLCSIMAA